MNFLTMYQDFIDGRSPRVSGLYSWLGNGLRLSLLITALGLVACETSSTMTADQSKTAIAPMEMTAANGERPVGYSADEIGSELERMMFRDCGDRQSEESGGILYELCTADNGQVLFASTALTSEGTGFKYWFRDNGALYAAERIEPAPAPNGLSILVEDQQTIIYVEGSTSQVFTDATGWQEQKKEAQIAVTAIQEHFANRKTASSPASADLVPEEDNIDSRSIFEGSPMGLLRLAREGGDPNHRWTTFTVPQASTAVSADGGALRWYDAHIAMMAALTAEQFCGRPSMRGAYFNYEADGGNVFMGEIFISCSEARSIIETYGQEQYAWVVLEEAGGEAESLDQRIPHIPDNLVPEFRRTVVQQFTPECLESGGTELCPGDRL